MSVQRNPLQALRDLTQKRIQIPKRENIENMHERYKNFRPNLSLDTDDVPEIDTFIDLSFQGDAKPRERHITPGSKIPFPHPGFQYLKGENIMNRVSPVARLPSRDSPNMTQISLFQSKNKSNAETDTIFMIKNRLEKGAQFFADENYEDAVLNFSQAEALVERYCTMDKKLSFETIALVYYNMLAANYK